MECTMWLEIFNEMTHLENVFIHFHMNAMHIQRQIRFATEYVHVYNVVAMCIEHIEWQKVVR